MSTPDLSAVLAQMWASFAPLARSRVELLEQYVSALEAGDDTALRAGATEAAHKLAGALGSYGRDGSAEAARLEALLRSASPQPDGVVPLVRALRAAVDA